MKLYRIVCNPGAEIISLTLCLALLTAPAFGQEPSHSEPVATNQTQGVEPPSEPAQKSSSEPAPEEPAEVEAEAVDSDKVAVNLKNVDIDKVITFLSRITGKTVMKHKDAKGKITLVSHEKVDPEQAIRMLCEALSLEKIAIVDRGDIIWLIPEKLLPQMDIGLIATGEAAPAIGVIRKAIPVRFANIAELEKLIRPLLSEKAGLIGLPGTKKIIVTDTVERIANLERVMAELDVLDIEDRQVRIFQLKHADAEELAPILKAMLTAPDRQSKSSSEPKKKDKSASLGNADRVDIEPYKIANWLLVVGPKEKVHHTALLIEELDKALPQTLEIRVVHVKYAEAVRIADELSKLSKKRHEKRVQDTVEITANARANCLVILSSEVNYQLLLKVIQELDTEESVEMKTQWFELKHSDAEDIAEQMNSLYSGMEEETSYWGWYRPRNKEKAKTRFVAERRSNFLIAIAAPIELAKIGEILERLDQPLDVDQVTPRIFSLKHIDANELAEVLNHVFGVRDTTRTGGYYDYLSQRFGDKGTEVGRLHGKVRFDPLLSINAVIVTTNNRENFAVIEKFIMGLDRTVPEAANLQVVPLKNASAEDVTRQLNILFAHEGTQLPQRKTTKEGEEETNTYSPYAFLFGSSKKSSEEKRPISNLIGGVRIVDDRRSNSLIITTAPQNHQAIKDLISGLDQPSPKVYVSVRLVEIIRVESSRIGIRLSSAPTVFESEDFDSGFVSTFGMTWEQAHGNGIVKASVDISALIQFMALRFNTRILSDTALMMENNKKGTMFVGAEIPFIEKSQITPEGTRADSFTYRKAGTTLTLTPKINEENEVLMNILLESSQIREGVVILGGQVLDTRKFDTMLRLQNQQTIVIGGIMREQELKGKRGVPILQHIPILNLLFRKKDTKNEITELVAFITPTVLRTTEEDDALTRETTEGLRERRDVDPFPKNPY